jgi:hypothetical protein
MKKQAIHLVLAPARFAALVLAIPAVLIAAEWEQNTSYYEDDAWYDISEWLDGNDYNPTDEVAGQWDDETYDWSAVESDRDNDTYTGYGYDKSNTSDDWYYDYSDDRNSYYDTANNDGIYDHWYTYHDYDDDGVYDALTSYHDTDADASYDERNYFYFAGAAKRSDASANEDASKDRGKDTSRDQTKNQSAKGMEVSGTVKMVKRVSVRNAPDRLVAQVANDQGQTFIVDLGPANQLGRNRQNQQQQQQSSESQANAQHAAEQIVKKGEQITARGPLLNVGDKQVLMSQSAKIGDQPEQQIHRAGQQVQGQISNLKTAKVRGQEHQLAILKLKSGKQALVDLGPADKLNVDLATNDQIQVQGVPVKVKDRLVFLATSVSKGDQQVNIQRMAARKSATSTP